MTRIFTRGLSLLAFLCALLAAPIASAGATPPPRNALLQARNDLTRVAGQASASSVRSSLGRALTQLKDATNRELWVGPAEANAPASGATVFSASAQALRDLEHVLPGSSRSAELIQAPAGTVRIIQLILAADRALAQGAIKQARGGPRKLLKAAEGDLAAGSHEATTGRHAAAVTSYENAWRSAFQALTVLVTQKVTGVPATAVTAAAEAALGSKKIGLHGPGIVPPGQPPLTADGKPEVFFAGSEACPFCGVERWGMIVALSQFGTFSSLHLMQSNPIEPPQVTTLTFFGSSYTSPYLTFVPVEAWSNIRKGTKLVPLQKLTPAEQALIHQFDPFSDTPLIDVANRFVNVRSTVFPRLIHGMSWTQVAGSLTHPSSISAQAIAGEAEVLSAELCTVTGGNPQSVCASPLVAEYQAALPHLNGRGGGCPAPTVSPSTTRRGRARLPRAQAARCHT